jgi:hypothetical protein
VKWAPLEADGWRRRADGWYAHPGYPSALRSADGRWWVAADIEEERVVMTPLGPQRAPGWFVDSGGRWVRESSETVAEGEAVDAIRAAARAQGLI